jgi:hypothetical protein
MKCSRAFGYLAHHARHYNRRQQNNAQLAIDRDRRRVGFAHFYNWTSLDRVHGCPDLGY